MYKMPRTIVAAIAFAALNVTPTFAGVKDVSNIADVLHPDIHQNVGGGNNANPNGVSPAGGGNLHGIVNTPGQSDADPGDGAPGFADQLETVHGGIGAVNKNALP
ncbi:MAG: hypothetical protein OER56_05530 [Hyphomicrobiales bacterium]|nr:hypothetical protein [Hyphomicrobiales bacterium]